MPKTLCLFNGPPTLADFALGQQNGEIGDVYTYHADLTDADKKVVGQIHGVMVRTSGATDKADCHRMTSVELDWHDSDDSLVIMGAHGYLKGQKEAPPGTPILRAIVGGTGGYMGARGQLKSTKMEDGWYRHELTLLD